MLLQLCQNKELGVSSWCELLLVTVTLGQVELRTDSCKLNCKLAAQGQNS